MIELLHGMLRAVSGSHVVLDVSGVGYGLDIPETDVIDLPSVDEVLTLWVYTRVREDAIQLFGFQNSEDRETFKILLQLSGVGPKVALGILSVFSASQLLEISREKRVSALQSISGIGKRTAEKILVELHAKEDKLIAACGETSIDRMTKRLGAVSSANVAREQLGAYEDLVSALTNLGFKEKEVAVFVQESLRESPDLDFEDSLKLVLMKLRTYSRGEGHRSNSVDR